MFKEWLQNNQKRLPSDKPTNKSMERNGMNKLTSEELFQLYLEKKKQETSKKGDQYITCGSCHKKSRIKNFSRVSDHYYEDCPYTPRYRRSEERGLICPKCNVLNRFLNEDSEEFLKILNFHGSYANDYERYQNSYHNELYFMKDGHEHPFPYEKFVNV